MWQIVWFRSVRLQCTDVKSWASKWKIGWNQMLSNAAFMQIQTTQLSKYRAVIWEKIRDIIVGYMGKWDTMDSPRWSLMIQDVWKWWSKLSCKVDAECPYDRLCGCSVATHALFFNVLLLLLRHTALEKCYSNSLHGTAKVICRMMRDVVIVT